MKGFLLGMLLLVGITAVSAIVLSNVDVSAEKTFTSSSGNVRVN